jgi:hypothetical protein
MAIGRLLHIGHIPHKVPLKGHTPRSRIDGIPLIRDPQGTSQGGVQAGRDFINLWLHIQVTFLMF